MSYRTLDVAREGALTWLTLNRPEALNALDSTMVDELRGFFTKLASIPAFNNLANLKSPFFTYHRAEIGSYKAIQLSIQHRFWIGGLIISPVVFYHLVGMENITSNLVTPASLYALPLQPGSFFGSPG